MKVKIHQKFTLENKKICFLFYKKSFLTALTLVLTLSSFSQQKEIVSSGGALFQNPTGTLTWTVGEIVTESFTNESGELNSGFHQGNIELTDISELNNFTEKIIVFPNPTSETITILVEDELDFNYYIYDINGNEIIKIDEKDDNKNISLSQMAPGLYFLKICHNNSIVKTIKISKI